MAAQDFTDWIPEEWQGPVISKMAAVSAVESLARPEPMATLTKHTPRSGGMTEDGAIAKSAAYGEATGANDEILLTARKFGKVVRIAEEDLRDTATLVDVVSTKQMEWARAHAIRFDVACLGTAAAENGTTVPFFSLYQALNTTNAATGYTADDNLIVTAGALTYADVSGAFGLYETSDYYDESRTNVIAHPGFKQKLRDLVDSQGRPIFVEYSSQANGSPDRLLGAPIHWTLGARTHATATSAPTGSPLLFVGNMDFLVRGDRSGPEYRVAGSDSGPAFTTDEALLKMRIRRACTVANENAFACIEYTAA